jgi:hypothetical protein
MLRLAQGLVMSDTPIQRKPPPKLDRVLAAHERRARLIAQLHEQAMATANDLSAQRKVSGQTSLRMPSAEGLKPGCFPQALSS